MDGAVRKEPVDSMKIEFNVEKEDDGTTEEDLKEVTASQTEKLRTARTYHDEVLEFEADPLLTWSQSSGSLSYDSGWSLHSLVHNLTLGAHRMDDQPVFPVMEARQKRIVGGVSPSVVPLDEHMLSEMNQALALRSRMGDMHTRISITRAAPHDRRGIVAKLFEASLQEYLWSSKAKRQLTMRVECGGEQCPTLTIHCAPGLAEQQCCKETIRREPDKQLLTPNIALMNRNRTSEKDTSGGLCRRVSSLSTTSLTR